MNVSFEKNADLTGTITVDVKEENYVDKVNKELKNIAKNRTLPGFRQGHAPVAQIKRMFGKQVKGDVLNNEVYQAVINYLRENKIAVLGEPLPINEGQVNLDDKDFTFKYEVGLAPEINVTVDKSLTLPFYEIEVSDEMINNQDEEFRQRYATREPGEKVEGRALVKGSIQQLNADGSVNENEGAIQVIDGIVAPFLFKSETEKEKFMGKAVGDKVVFNPYDTCDGNPVELSSMLNIDKEIAKDIKDNFVMAISEIILAKDAEHNEEFYTNVFGADKVHNEEEYRQAVKNLIAQQLVGNSVSLFDHQVREYLVNTYGNFDLPVEFLKKWLVARNEELTAETIDKEFENMLPALKWQLIEDKVVGQLNVNITEADMLDYAKSLATRQFMQYGMTNIDEATIESTAKRILNDKEYRKQISEQVANAKFFNAVRDAITIDKKEISFDDFKAMVAKINGTENA